jgi:hypothetical protein
LSIEEATLAVLAADRQFTAEAKEFVLDRLKKLQQ